MSTALYLVGGKTSFGLNLFSTFGEAIIESAILLSGDAQTGTDWVLLSGDAQSGTDRILVSGE